MKKTQVKLFLKFVLLTLLITLIFTLTSCSAGSEQVLSADELSENMLAEEDFDIDYVWKYLDRWDFPVFSAGKLKRVENLYRENYYKEIPDPYELALSVADTFLKKSYSKTDLTDSEAVTDAIITAYVSAIGDDFSYYRTSSQYQAYTQNLSGTFVGIGVTVTYTKGDEGLTVVDPIKNSPAEEAGILSEDMIVSIDGESVVELGYSASLEKIKGEKGTAVALKIKRGDQLLDLTVTRGPVVENTVDYYITDEKIGYIDINSFKANTDELFCEAIDYMKAEGARAIIYDVRNNGGGYLQTVMHMLDYIAPDGITLASFSNDYDDEYVAEDGHSLSIPTVILCNNSSASAAELFTAGPRDLGALGHFDVTIVGKKTFGKGIMQNSYRLSDKSAITLTVAYYYPPSGVNFHGEGVFPDEEVSGTKAQMDCALKKAAEMISK